MDFVVSPLSFSSDFGMKLTKGPSSLVASSQKACFLVTVPYFKLVVDC